MNMTIRICFAALLAPIAIPGFSQENFPGVTAKTGADWIAQCERPATKAQPQSRISACDSFVDGARLMVAAFNSNTQCSSALRAAPLGALLDVTFLVAKENPSAPTSEIFAKSFLGVRCKT